MAERILFGNTVLKGINKGGILKPDEQGYYTVVLGALGVQNSSGEMYVDSTIARQTFQNNGTLMRRINQGLLRGEWGHPDPSDFPNFMMFERRVRAIKEDRISHHISEVWLEEIDYQGKKVLGILGKVRPSGPYGKAMQDALENPNENVTFSGRYYSNISNKSGQRCREIHTVATWDFVSEPGVEMAQKYLSPSLESIDDTVFYREQLEEAARYESQHRELEMSMESSGYRAQDLIDDLGFKAKAKPQRASMRW